MPHSLLKAPPQQAFSLWTCLWGEFFPTGAPPDAEQFRTAAIGTSRAQAVARAAGAEHVEDNVQARRLLGLQQPGHHRWPSSRWIHRRRRREESRPMWKRKL